MTTLLKELGRQSAKYRIDLVGDGIRAGIKAQKLYGKEKKFIDQGHDFLYVPVWRVEYVNYRMSSVVL